jgi:ribosome-dependent ATPase
MTDAVVKLTGLTHRYGTVIAVEGIDLELPRGKTVGFIGPDGVGKSTLLALISGAREIQTGKVEVLGGDMADRHHRERVCPLIAYMPQGLGKNLYPTLSVFENVDFFGRLFGHSKEERRQRAQQLLTDTDLIRFVDRPAGKLSGGMKQKLSLCCALIHDPDLLILDEPTTGVDPLSRRQFWELIERIRQGRPQMSVLVATAYMEEAAQFDTLVAMDAGHILATGTPQELIARSKKETLEEAFISFLPPEKLRGHQEVKLPTRREHEGPVAIEAHGLTRRFGSFVAVDHVSFRIERGEIFGFLGSNGCGKTTTMKMLTGLLPVSEGTVALFGKPVEASDLETKRRVGYMSQAFSLYSELTVRQNLDLNARLFRLKPEVVRERVEAMIERFDLHEVAEQRPDALPLGIRQRLSLAVALVHGPEMLILDEPTSGVDPIARDQFWQILIDLSRNDGVTIFISTHFMNEAQRCDRISLMHAGKVLADGTPDELVRRSGKHSLEETFIAYLEEATQADGANAPPPLTMPAAAPSEATPSHEAHAESRFSIRRLWAYARREATEIRRDPIRLLFSLLVPVLLMIAFSYGISFDIENMPYAVLDQDHTPESREYLDQFASSRYFTQLAPILDHGDLERRMRRGDLKMAIEIPPGFGRDLRRGYHPEVGVWVDGSMPFRAETSRSYAEGVHQTYLNALTQTDPGRWGQRPPIEMSVRFRYNQDFQSVYAMAPGVIMLVLMLIPAMMTAVGVVREKEVGSIINLYVTPVTGIEFLLGKQLPYVVLGLINFICLTALATLVLGVPVKGSVLALVLGAFLYVLAATGFGLLVSTFVRSQVAAIFAAAILSVMPAVQFSGFLTPVSSLSGSGRIIGQFFPSTYFQHISIGAFTKGLGFFELLPDLLGILAFYLFTIVASRLFLRTQET